MIKAKSMLKLVDRYRVTDGAKFRLKDYPTKDKPGLDVDKAEDGLAKGVMQLAELQATLSAQDRWGVLVIFQAMDAAGKDGTIKHVFSGLNPQGTSVESFKQPTLLELDHDFLWRHVTHLPQRGRIGIHNRSWYEEVLVLRVHPELLMTQHIPPELIGKKVFDERLEDIAAFERYLGRQGIRVLKFYLHMSKEEQRSRFLSRIDEPEKNWKFSAGDVAERAHWDSYQKAYDHAIRATATEAAPWYVIPADDKRYARLIVVAAMVEALEALKLQYPKPTQEQRSALIESRALLEE
ncbi:PPK2 family polyphosphate:nucleotide phosphotransferase [Humitalea rosea]|uniref:PPK2 family polyphosphate:nucleotide phosphotransferase n=1 Tax=Humitalea rosea TaxID=990373 RepID=A0A2W7HZL5_9PROT|nr:polyphosphate kinase 2 family protein [Humitalea rosea]PZW38652.1 PPK2 family polyphosphate:nucleotide phosphotransferase [Humitalea rosea]